MNSTFSALKSFGSAALDLVLPPRCLGSGEIVATPGTISPSFFAELSFIAKPFCDICGLPFSVEAEGAVLCGACLEHPPHFHRARAALIYTDASRDVILSLKYGDKLHAAKTFAPMMLRAAGDIVTPCDMIVPVPLHPWRLWHRRFNQAAVLSHALSHHTGIRVENNILKRQENTIPQRGLSRKERNDNVKNAFAIDIKHTSAVREKTVLLIDDVYTSGATLNACAKALLNAGASTVNVLTIARVTREEF